MTWIALLWLPVVVGCKKSTSFLDEEGVALENHVIATVGAYHVMNCVWECVNTPLCFSINTHAQKRPSGWFMCDLNNSSRAADPQDFVMKPGCRYHEMTEASHCMMNECIYKAALPDGWFVFGSKKLKIFPERKTWGRARKYCQAIGGELVSINSEEKNEFISRLLERVITNATTGKSHPSQVMAHWTLDGSDTDIKLMEGATYREEDGFQSLYLNGSGAYATTPSVEFGRNSFTIASWVKLQSPVTNQQSPIYSDWSHSLKFLIQAYELEKLRFGGYNNLMEHKPWLSAGSPPVDKWFHVTAAWDQLTNEATLFLDGGKVGSQNQTSGSYLKDNSSTLYDIGLKRDSGDTLRGFLRDLIIIGKALSEKEIATLSDPNNEPFAGVWIGLNDVSKEGTFRWTDNSDVTFTKWASIQPDNRNGYEDCVEMAVHGGNWEDTSCGRQLPFVCQKD